MTGVLPRSKLVSMKLSVSIPDDLWDEARALGKDLNPSHLVQEGLRRWVEEAARKPGFSVDRPEDIEADFETARARFAEEARAEFERAYRKAVQVAAKLPWREIEFLAEHYKFNVERWAKATRESALMAMEGRIPKEWAPKDETVRAMIDGLGGLAHPVGDEMWQPSPTYLKGFTQGMRDLWTTVMEGGEK